MLRYKDRLIRLHGVFRLAEVVVFTASAAIYADKVLDWLDPGAFSKVCLTT